MSVQVGSPPAGSPERSVDVLLIHYFQNFHKFITRVALRQMAHNDLDKLLELSAVDLASVMRQTILPLRSELKRVSLSAEQTQREDYLGAINFVLSKLDSAYIDPIMQMSLEHIKKIHLYFELFIDLLDTAAGVEVLV